MKTRLVRRTAVRRVRPREVVLVRRQSQHRTPRTALVAPLAVVVFCACLLNALATTDARDALLTPLLGLIAVTVMVAAGCRAALVLTAILSEPR